MAKIKRSLLKEDTVGWSTMKRPSPFKIGTAPPPVMDGSSQMNAIYLQRRAEEAAMFNEKLRLVGQLDKLEPLFTTLFRDLVDAKNFIESQSAEPLLTKKHTVTMSKMVKILDEMAQKVGEELVPLCDDLVVDNSEDPLGLRDSDSEDDSSIEDHEGKSESEKYGLKKRDEEF